MHGAHGFAGDISATFRIRRTMLVLDVWISSLNPLTIWIRIRMGCGFIVENTYEGNELVALRAGHSEPLPSHPWPLVDVCLIFPSSS